MLSSFTVATSSSPSSVYETPPAWWKFNSTTTTSCAALAAALFPSSVPLSQDISSTSNISSNVVEKRTNNIDHHYHRE
jgi:hypothetical protein